MNIGEINPQDDVAKHMAEVLVKESAVKAVDDTHHYAAKQASRLRSLAKCYEDIAIKLDTANSNG